MSIRSNGCVLQGPYRTTPASVVRLPSVLQMQVSERIKRFYGLSSTLLETTPI